MQQFHIILFVVILLSAPLLAGYGLRRFVNWRNPHKIIGARSVYISVGGHVLCLLGCLVSILFLKIHLLSHAASLLLGAVFFCPGLLIVAYIGSDKQALASIEAGEVKEAEVMGQECKSEP